jgi:hypothetical protein
MNKNWTVGNLFPKCDQMMRYLIDDRDATEINTQKMRQSRHTQENGERKKRKLETLLTRWDWIAPQLLVAQ